MILTKCVPLSVASIGVTTNALYQNILTDTIYSGRNSSPAFSFFLTSIFLCSADFIFNFPLTFHFTQMFLILQYYNISKNKTITPGFRPWHRFISPHVFIIHAFSFLVKLFPSTNNDNSILSFVKCFSQNPIYSLSFLLLLCL